MAQYTSTKTTGGGVTVNTVLDTITNQVTYTLTTADGYTATATQNSIGAVGGSTSASLKLQLAKAGADAQTFSIGLNTALSQTTTGVTEQATQADVTATETGNPPPDEKQAIPVNPDTDPTVEPPASTEKVENANPAPTEQSDTVTEEPGYAPLQEPPTVKDEFDGIDQQVAENENTLKEPPVLSEEEATDYLRNQNTEQVESKNPSSNVSGIAPKTNTQSQATQQDITNFYQNGDWRVRLSLAPGSTYLYNAPTAAGESILKPLAATNGVLFPYTPNISVQYAAHYDSSDIVHSNYKIFQYKSSSVDQISITCDFTAQDTFEANYLLAVIHFFRSVTKMFYGLDENPTAGTPPPLCYLTGLGAFQFDKHPLAITSFNYSLPTDVDYIRAGSSTNQMQPNPGQPPKTTSVLNSPILTRLKGLMPGAKPAAPKFPSTPSGAPTGSQEPTYVPTKIQLNITAIPIVTRNDISNQFSLAKYATGELLRGSKRKGGGGIW